MSKRTTRTGRHSRYGRRPQPQRRVPVVWWLIGGVVVLAAVIALVAGSGGGNDKPRVGETRDVTVSGDALPKSDDPVNDPAVGLKIPDVSGSLFDGTPIRITKNGHPKLLVFLAHWCPHCQKEVPVVTRYLDEQGGLPDAVDLLAMATSTTPSRPNYPPSAWLEREGWPVPTMADDAASSAGNAFGISSFPAFIAVSPTGTVVARRTGEISTDEFQQLIDLAAAG